MIEGESIGGGGRKRARGGGGAARRAERTAPKLEVARFIERNIPNFEVLNDEAIEIIEHNAETVLEEIGVNFIENHAALERWKEAGADVQGDRVHIPRGLARQLCSTAPSMYTQHARNAERSVDIGGKNLVLAPVYGPPFVRDLEGGSPLCHHGRLREVREAGLYVQMAAPLGRHGLRADGCGRQQAPPGHALRPYALVGQALSWARSQAPERAVDSVKMCEILFGKELSQ